MPSIIRNDAVETCLRRILKREGYGLSKPKHHGQTGVDIIAEKGMERFHIEVIGYKSSGPARSKDFYEVFFRAISRIKDGATHCIIALPSRAGPWLPRRAGQYGVAWRRIGKAFPELHVWLVDVDKASYKKTSWSEWL